MTEQIQSSDNLDRSEVNSEPNIANTLYHYQIEQLHNEIQYLNSRLSIIPRPVEFASIKLMQLWWTITSLVGLGWLHDGTRKHKIDESDEVTVAFTLSQSDTMQAPRVFLDVTETYKKKTNTGVQRVIRKLCQEGVENNLLIPAVINDGKFTCIDSKDPIKFNAYDRILLLDTGWENISIYPSALSQAKEKGTEIIIGIHDLIPVQYPGFVQPYFTIVFQEWLKTITPYCSAALAVSRHSAESFIEWKNSISFDNKITAVGWFHLGCDFDNKKDPKLENLRSSINIPIEYFLSVGTIEPRKGYSVALDAFDRLWLQGSTTNYVIIGRSGRLAQNIIDRIIHNPQFGKKLHWPQNVDDQKLNEYYSHCKGVILPTLAEGFGLPLIEASSYKKPIIASDLPVFREISQPGVNFFKSGDASNLFNCLKSPQQLSICNNNEIDLSWKSATINMTNIIRSNSYQIKL